MKTSLSFARASLPNSSHHPIRGRHVEHRLAEQVALAGKPFREVVDVRQHRAFTIAQTFVLHREREDDIDLAAGLDQSLFMYATIAAVSLTTRWLMAGEAST